MTVERMTESDRLAAMAALAKALDSLAQALDDYQHRHPTGRGPEVSRLWYLAAEVKQVANHLRAWGVHR